ncbi:PH-like domain-containing protein [Microbacterium sp. NPDC055903]
MTREALFLIAGLFALAILLLMLFAWRRRLRRDAAFSAPLGVPEHAEVQARHEVLYVSTTRHDQPLERLAISPLAYRARGELAVTDRGVALCLDGAPTVFLAKDRLKAVDRATVTIDRVVEKGGLVKLVWDVADAHPVDSYLRLASGDPQTLISELRPLIAAPTTGAHS